MNYYNRRHELWLRESLTAQGLTEEQINEFLGSLMKGIGSGVKAGFRAGVDKFKQDRAEKDANSLAFRAKAQRDAYRQNPASVDQGEFRKLQLSSRDASNKRIGDFVARRNAALPKRAQLKGLDPSRTAAMKKMSANRYAENWQKANKNRVSGNKYGMNVDSTHYGDVANMIRESLDEGKLCAKGKSAAKRKYDVYPSAYANMYASAVCSGKVKSKGKKK